MVVWNFRPRTTISLCSLTASLLLIMGIRLATWGQSRLSFQACSTTAFQDPLGLPMGPFPFPRPNPRPLPRERILPPGHLGIRSSFSLPRS